VIGTLTDSGPIYALIDRDDAYHRAAVRGVEQVILPMLTTWPCLTEAMHFLHRRVGLPGARALRAMLLRGDVVAVDPALHAIGAVCDLMERYADAPMDLADASLVAASMDLADASLVAASMDLGKLEVFTFDTHFRAYRGPRGRRFRVYPEG